MRLSLDGFLFSAEYHNGKMAEITSRVAANFVGWRKGRALFERASGKVIRALRTEQAGREKPPLPRLCAMLKSRISLSPPSWEAALKPPASTIDFRGRGC